MSIVNLYLTPGLHIQKANIPRSYFTGEPAATNNTQLFSCFTQANSPAVKKSSIFASIEFKNSRAFLKKLPFFGKKKIETGTVDLLIIRLYLGKIGVDRKIEREIKIGREHV